MGKGAGKTVEEDGAEKVSERQSKSDGDKQRQTNTERQIPPCFSAMVEACHVLLVGETRGCDNVLVHVPTDALVHTYQTQRTRNMSAT